MNILSSTSNVSTYSSSLSLQSIPTSSTASAGVDSDGDTDGSTTAASGSQDGGQVLQAMLQALQGLGLNSNPVGTTTPLVPANNADKPASSPSVSATSSSLVQDLRQFLQTLTQTVQSQDTGNTNSGASNSPSSSGFSAGLSTLITQVSNGNTPGPLQSAFNQLQADLQGGQTTSSNQSTDSSSPVVSLAAVLTQFQQNIGYGNSANSVASVGNLLNVQA